MKWIEISPNHYKYVPDDHRAPAVILPTRRGIPNVISTPPWAVSEQGIRSEDPHEQVKATDDFTADRKKWTQRSRKWASWENGRKQELQKNKPLWRKEQMKRDPLL
jgi:hypothetical protein